MKYVAYYRVSKNDQHVDAQKTAVERYIRSTDSIIMEFEEYETGTKKVVRPIIKKALAYAKDNDATLIIAKLDRLSRNVVFIGTLLESKVKFIACDLPEANELTIHIFAAFAQHEAKMISERTKAALAELKKKGVKLGSPNPGFKKEEIRKMGNIALTINSRENENNIKAQALIKSLKDNGNTFKSITSELNNLGFRTRRDCYFKETTVQRLYNRF